MQKQGQNGLLEGTVKRRWEGNCSNDRDLKRKSSKKLDNRVYKLLNRPKGAIKNELINQN